MITIKNNLFTKELVPMVLIVLLLLGFAFYFFGNSATQENSVLEQDKIVVEIDEAVVITAITSNSNLTDIHDELIINNEQEEIPTSKEECKNAGPTPDILGCLYKVLEIKRTGANKMYKDTVQMLTSLTDKKLRSSISPQVVLDYLNNYMDDHEAYYAKSCEISAYGVGNGNPYQRILMTCQIDGYNQFIETLENAQAHFEYLQE